jgi:hypothetical protein
MASGGTDWMGLVGGLWTAYGEAQAGRENRAIANWNAGVADLQAQSAIDRGFEAETRHRTEVRGLVGAQRAAYAGQGIDVNDANASAGQVQLDTQAIGEQDALTIRNNATLEAWGYRVNAASQRWQGAAAERRGNKQATGTIITTGAETARSAYGAYSGG